jgi:phospholipid/cholesterol/gamma-HCH transport system substrate-binding protein
MRRRDEVLVGLLTVVALVTVVAGGLWLARGGLQPGYPLYAAFPWGSGLKQGQPVQLAGVTIGFVDEVSLRMDGTLLVKMGIRREYQVPKGSTASVEPNGIFGDQLIAVTPKAPTTEVHARGDTLPAGVPKPTVGDLLMQVDTIAKDVKSMTRALDTQLVQDGALTDVRTTIREIAALAQTLAKTVEVQSANLDRTMAAVRKSAEALDSGMVDSTLRNLQTTSGNVAVLSQDLQQTTQSLNALLTRLDRGEGTAGKLMTDDSLYADLRRLVTRIDSVTADFKQNPRRYVKLSIF